MGDRLNTSKRLVMRTRPYLRLRDLTVRAHRDNELVTREDLARRYLRGTGIEIGALTKPMRVPPDVHVRYVDRKSREALLREDGPELQARGLDVRAIPATVLVDEAAELGTFADRSLDFVVAHHVLEHLEDPIAALEAFLRVLRPQGILLLTLPDARHTFDAPRERTTTEHVIRDHAEGPLVSRRAHYEEWARLIEGVPDEDGVAARVEEYARQDARHHFHVWELDGFLELLRDVPLESQLLEARVCGIEFAVVLRRLDTTRRRTVASLRMASVHEQESYDVPADAMWERIGDFHGLHAWHPAVMSQDALDDGKVRVLHLDGGGTITETLVDQSERSYTYRIDDSPLPVSDYTATTAVLDEDGGRCVIDWRADFQAAGASEEEAQEVISGIFRAGLDALR